MNLSQNNTYQHWIPAPKSVLALFLLLSFGCTKDHRIADHATNVHGHLIGFLGCTRNGIQAGSTRFIITNNIDSFLVTDSSGSGNVIFSYKNLKFGIESICMVDGDFIEVTAIRSDD